MLTNLLHDMMLAGRGLRRSPAFALTAIGIIATGITAAALVASIGESVLIRPVAVPDIQHLAIIEEGVPQLRIEHSPLAPAEVFDLAERRDLFTSVAGYRVGQMNLTGGPTPERVTAASTIGSFFDVLDVRPTLGRLYDRTAARGDTRILVISNEFWHSAFAADPQVVDRRVQLDDSLFTIIGVLPPGFDFPRGTQAWTPHPSFFGFDQRDNRCCEVATAVARVRADVSPARLAAALTAQMHAWEEHYPRVYAVRGSVDNHARTIEAVPLAYALSGRLRPIISAVTVAVALLLLIACLNVACLALVRTMSHSGDMAVRVALGASSGTMVRGVAAECAYLAGIGGAIGIALARGIVALLERNEAWRVAVAADISLDWRVTALAAVVCVGSAVVFGLAPALAATRADIRELLSARSSPGIRRPRVLDGAVVLQVALALSLALACVVSARSLERLLSVDPGFKPDGVVRMRLSLNGARYASNPSRVAFLNSLMSRLRQSNGTIAVGMVSGGPFGYVKQVEHSTTVRPVGATPDKDVHASIWVIGGDYFRAMGIPVRSGRVFTDADIQQGPRVWLVDESLARRLFGSVAAAVGKSIDWPPSSPSIIGVVGSIKKTDLGAADEPSLYWSFAQYPTSDVTVVLRTALSTAAAFSLMREAVYEVDSTLPPFDFTTLESGIADSVAPRRLGAGTLVALTAISLLLAAFGVYAVLGFSMSLRKREMGVRIALGATLRDIEAIVLVAGARLVALGMLLGLVLFIVSARAAAAVVFGVSALDPLSIALGCSVVGTAGIVAAWLPARRAARTDPMSVIRSQ